LNHYGDEMTESVDAVQSSLSSHHEDALAQTDLTGLRSMERSHMDDVAMRMGRMLDAEHSMEVCAEHMSADSDGEGLQRLHQAHEAMAVAIDDASSEVEHHFQAMLDAGDLNAAMAEEHRHQAEMESIVAGMHRHDEDLGAAMHAMRDEGMSMMCPMDSHMHHRH
jgi:hypothetical protein